MKAYERFLKYVAVPTMSDGDSQSVPSSAKQLVLGKMLVSEMKEIGIRNARIDEFGYVYGELPSNCGKETETVGFIAHMDTSGEAPDENIKARLTEYTGGDIRLNEEKNIYMKVADYPYLEDFKGQTLIVTDGTTLLGADDKAGIAEILTACEIIISEGLPHGNIKLAFTPDEEIGRGADKFDVDGFGADYAYTVDGGTLGEIEYENFNAAGATIIVHGVSIHPGGAKDRMKNAITIAEEFDRLLPPDEIPERTEGYEGFHHLHHFSGSVERAEMSYIIRDHDYGKLLCKKETFANIADKLNEKYGDGTIELHLRESYRNMKEKILNHMYIIERAEKAMRSVGVEPVIVPIRGGTDGARLSFMGLPCPNLCTGGVNFHSRFEFIPAQSLEKITDIIIKIITDITETEEK